MNTQDEDFYQRDAEAKERERLRGLERRLVEATGLSVREIADVLTPLLPKVDETMLVGILGERLKPSPVSCEGEFVTLDVEKILQGSDMAFQVKLRGGLVIWIPKSQIKGGTEAFKVGDESKAMVIPSWLANEKTLGGE